MFGNFLFLKKMQSLIILIGPPGSGKGVLCHSLNNQGFITLGSGETIRSYVQEKKNLEDELAKRMSLAMEQGLNINDDDLLFLLKEKITTLLQFNQKILGDGIMRTVVQAKMLEEIAVEANIIILVFNLNISLQEAQGRLATRYYVGSVVYSSKAEAEANCSRGEKVIRRGDDKPYTINTRYGQYFNNKLDIESVCNQSPWFDLFQIDGEQSKEKVYSDVNQIVTNRGL